MVGDGPPGAVDRPCDTPVGGRLRRVISGDGSVINLLKR